MKKIWMILIGVVIFAVVLGIGAAAGGAATYFFLNEDIAAVFASPREENSQGGVVVSAVAEGSAAADAGLVRGDILLKVGTDEVNSLSDIWDALKAYIPGETVDLTVLHGDEIRTLTTDLDERDGKAFLGISTCIGPMHGDVMIEDLPFRFDREVEIITQKGAVITQVVEGSPADQAGLEVGDTILQVNEIEPGSGASLSDLIRNFEPGDVVQLVLIRDGSELEIDVKLGENPDKAGQAYLGIYFEPALPSLPFDHGGEGFFFDDVPGFPFGHLDGDREMPFLHDDFPGMHRFENLPEGIDQAIIIGDVLEGTPADEAGLRLKDLIIYIDDKTLDGVDSFVENIQTREPGEKVVLTVYRDGEMIEVEVILGKHPDNPESGYLGVMVSGFINVKVDGQMPENFEFDLEKELKFPGGDA